MPRREASSKVLLGLSFPSLGGVRLGSRRKVCMLCYSFALASDGGAGYGNLEEAMDCMTYGLTR